MFAVFNEMAMKPKIVNPKYELKCFCISYLKEHTFP